MRQPKSPMEQLARMVWLIAMVTCAAEPQPATQQAFFAGFATAQAQHGLQSAATQACDKSKQALQARTRRRRQTTCVSTNLGNNPTLGYIFYRERVSSSSASSRRRSSRRRRRNGELLGGASDATLGWPTNVRRPCQECIKTTHKNAYGLKEANLCTSCLNGDYLIADQCSSSRGPIGGRRRQSAMSYKCQDGGVPAGYCVRPSDLTRTKALGSGSPMLVQCFGFNGDSISSSETSYDFVCYRVGQTPTWVRHHKLPNGKYLGGKWGLASRALCNVFKKIQCKKVVTPCGKTVSECSSIKEVSCASVQLIRGDKNSDAQKAAACTPAACVGVAAIS